MTTDQIVHGLLRSYGRFIEPSVHAEFAADLRAAIFAVAAAERERNAILLAACKRALGTAFANDGGPAYMSIDTLLSVRADLEAAIHASE